MLRSFYYPVFFPFPSTNHPPKKNADRLFQRIVTGRVCIVTLVHGLSASELTHCTITCRNQIFGWHSIESYLVTLPKTNSKSPWKNSPKRPQKETRKYSNHPISGAKMLVSGMVISYRILMPWLMKLSIIWLGRISSSPKKTPKKTRFWGWYLSRQMTWNADRWLVVEPTCLKHMLHKIGWFDFNFPKFQGENDKKYLKQPSSYLDAFGVSAILWKKF